MKLLKKKKEIINESSHRPDDIVYHRISKVRGKILTVSEHSIAIAWEDDSESYMHPVDAQDILKNP